MIYYTFIAQLPENYSKIHGFKDVEICSKPTNINMFNIGEDIRIIGKSYYYENTPFIADKDITIHGKITEIYNYVGEFGEICDIRKIIYIKPKSIYYYNINGELEELKFTE